ncbi:MULTISPECIES: hypothetical protein [unclassified Streptomyces]|uniref:hypothetical protein n=1 Tax=unclassified Streptomyces TaxID=2593676 RepID=UPI002E227DB0|nr:hypothetical protein OG217_38340 [Streptomyces sp. NBC_01023]
MLETFGTAVVVKVLTHWTDLVEAMVDVVAGRASSWSSPASGRGRRRIWRRSRRRWPSSRTWSTTACCAALADHLLRLLELRDPSARRNGVKTLHIGMVEPTEALERFFVASETAAVVSLPSFHGSEGFDCGT